MTFKIITHMILISYMNLHKLSDDRNEYYGNYHQHDEHYYLSGLIFHIGLLPR